MYVLARLIEFPLHSTKKFFVAHSMQRLEKAKQKAAKAEVAKALSEADLVRISELLSNGVSQRSVASIMGVSQSFIQRNKPRESATL